MKKTRGFVICVGLVVAFFMSLTVCGCGTHDSSNEVVRSDALSVCLPIESSGEEIVSYPQLFEKEVEGRTVLVDASGEVWHYFENPVIRIEMNTGCSFVGRQTVYMPGAIPLGGFDYHGYEVHCSAFIRQAKESENFLFGSQGGRFFLPSELTKCIASAYIVDDTGQKFSTEYVVLDYSWYE